MSDRIVGSAVLLILEIHTGSFVTVADNHCLFSDVYTAASRQAAPPATILFNGDCFEWRTQM